MTEVVEDHHNENNRDYSLLWSSPYDQVSTSWYGDEGASMTRPSHIDLTISDVILTLRSNMNTFWKENKDSFRSFWTLMKHQSRENFVRSVHPTIVQSLRDRYSILLGAKVYDERHDRDLILAPKMTIEGLISGNYLIELIDILCNLEQVQKVSNRMVLDLRRLNRFKRFPFTEAEKVQRDDDTPAYVGQTFVMQGGAAFGLNISIEDANILAQIVTEDYNLYKLGKISYKYEFDIASSCVYFIYTLIGRLLDEFRVKVLHAADGRSLLDTRAVCGFCSKPGSENVVLKQCRQCLSVQYCSV